MSRDKLNQTSAVFRTVIVMSLGIGFLMMLAGCRLYEPPRYARLEFAAGAPRTHVLFVGNSMTYYNDLPGLVQQLSAREARPVQFDAVTAPFMSLQYHWWRGSAKGLLEHDRWDYVVLQDFSRKPATDPEGSAKYFELFDAEAQKAGARTVIFQNWTREGHADEYDALAATYREVQHQTHASIAPIGLAWRLCAREHPEIELLADDRHPTDAGTYLTGCVLYGVIYGKNPETLPLNLTGPKLPVEQIMLLRRIAEQALRAAGSMN